MSDPAPVIIEAAINGQTPKRLNPNVPRSSQELVADALRCLAAGAAIVHTHIDEIRVAPEQAARDYESHFRPILERRPEALLYPTVGFGETMEQRLAHQALLLESCSLRIGIADPGSVNLGGAGPDGLPLPNDFVYANSSRDIRTAFELCERLRLGPSIAIFEPGFLRHALAYQRAGRLPQGALIKFYLGGERGYAGTGAGGLGFGLPPSPWALDVYLEILGDAPLPWSVGVLGGDVFEHDLARHALERGGHLHLGLEDYAGPLQPRNEDLVRRAVELCERLGRPVASCEEAAKILRLPR